MEILMKKEKEVCDYQVEIQKQFNKCLNEVLKKLEWKEIDICKKMFEYDGLDEEVFQTLQNDDLQKFHTQRYDYTRNIPLKAIKVIKLEFDQNPQIERDCFNKLFNLWKEMEKYRETKLSPFLEMANYDLIWITNNLEKLLEIPHHKVVFYTYLSLLNTVGKKEYNSTMEYVFEHCDNINEPKLQEKELDFINVYNFKLRDAIDCLLEIEKCERFWKIREPKTRAILADLWRAFHYMDELETEIYLKYISYDNEKGTGPSQEQMIMTAIAMVLNRNQDYKK